MTWWEATEKHIVRSTAICTVHKIYPYRVRRPVMLTCTVLVAQLGNRVTFIQFYLKTLKGKPALKTLKCMIR